MSYTPPVGDATSTTKGVIRLSGDFSGTAASPTVPGLAQKIDASSVGQVGGVAALDGDGDVVNASGVKVQEIDVSNTIPHDPDAPTIAALPAGALYTTSS